MLSCLALVGGSRWLHGAEETRLKSRANLIGNLAGWESAVDDPAALRVAVDQVGFTPDDPVRNSRLTARFQFTSGGDTTRLVALLDRSGSPLSVRPSPETVRVTALGPAWSTAWAGGNAVSPVFELSGRAVRATVVPVGGPRPWAVLVSVSTEQGNEQLGTAISALLRLRGKGSVSTVDQNGVAVISTDRGLAGARVLDAADLDATRRLASLPRSWTSGDYTHIAAHQPTTGYTTYLTQPTEQLYGELRSHQFRRDIALLVVTMAAVLSIAVVGLHGETRARRRHDEVSSLLAATRDIVLTVSADGLVEYVSPAVLGLLGHDPAALRGRPLSDLVHQADTRRVCALLAERRSATVMNVRLLSGTGSEHWFDVSARPPTEAGSTPRDRWDVPRSDRRASRGDRRRASRGDRPAPRVVLTCHSIERRKGLLDQLGFQAGHDPLTGLANRATFDERLAAALDERPPDGPVSVLFIDLDHFKPINDTYGHAAGDQVLTVVADRLTAALADSTALTDSTALAATTIRGGPVAAREPTASRFGGDEFGVVLPGVGQEAAVAIAERVSRALREPVSLETAVVTVDASIGVGVASTACRAENLLRAADEAMYRAKAAGRGRHAVAAVGASPLPPGPREPAEPSGPLEPGTGSGPADPPAGQASSGGNVREHDGSPTTTRSTAAQPPATQPPATQPPATQAVERQPVERKPVERKPVAGPSSARQAAAGPLRTAAGHATSGSGRSGCMRNGDGRGPQRAPGCRRRLAAAVPSVIVVLVLLGTAATRLAMEAAERARARHQRLAAGALLVSHFAEYAHAISDPDRLTGAVSDFPWDLEDPTALAESLRTMALTPIAGPSALLAVVGPDGSPKAVQPPGAMVPIPPNDPFWTLSSHGGALTSLLPVDGHNRICTVVPILRDGSPAAQLLLCPTKVLPAARALRMTDGLASDLGQGGVSVLDQNGQAVLAWDAALVGRVLVDRAELAGIQPGQPRQVRSHSGPDTIAVAAAIPGGGYVLLDQTADVVELSVLEYRATGEGLLFGIIGVTVLGLAVANRRRERAISQDLEELGVLLHETHDIVVLLDRAGRLAFVNAAVDRLLGHDGQAMIGQDPLRYVHPEDRTAVRALLHAPREAPPLLDVRLATPDGTYRWFDIAAAVWETRAGQPRVPVLTCREIGEWRGLTEQARRRARLDPLTGLPNRAALAEHLEAIARDRTAFAILLVDLDGFKPVNDTFGHAVGDQVLQVTAARIRRILAADGAPERGGDPIPCAGHDPPGPLVAPDGPDSPGRPDRPGGPAEQGHARRTDAPAVPAAAAVPADDADDADASAGQFGAERDGAERDGAERDGAERDGAERDGAERRRLRRPSSWFRRGAGQSWYQPERGAVFRVGGDEFVAVLAGPSTALAGGLDVEAVAWHTADQITLAVREPISAGGSLVSVGATVGVALSRGLADPQAVVGLADAAMYEAKRSSGRGRPRNGSAALEPPTRQGRADGNDGQQPRAGAQHVW
ncbi:diguanylate cyclase domain-containing protein [Frankia sp. EI5c]|uniref:diguanylate cyclase domain-containing protein n=1 Tax=Frankia sp. EI5c TaxID=683316 RepID=UPI0008242729|nr:diguanylate cyclase [Frankia sp. EI5c]